MIRVSERRVLQSDYGGFNPRFLGVTLRYDSAENYNAAYEYLVGARLSEVVQGLHSIVLRSVIDHEARHYIDFLISPYSTAVFRLRLMALVNAAQALALAREMPGTVLPVPITQWSLFDKSERAAAHADWREMLGEAAMSVTVPSWTVDGLQRDVPPAMASLAHLPDNEKFALYVEAAVRSYLRIDQLTQGFAEADASDHMRPAYIHEASALSVQLAAIYVGQGESEALDFLDFLLSADLPQARVWRTHLKVASLLDRLWSHDESPLAGVRRILTITVWAMLGSYTKDRARACPATRFTRLVGGLVRDSENPRWSGDIDDPESLTQMWDFWDERLEVTSWRTALAEHIASGRQAVETYHALKSKWQGASDIPQLVSTAMELTLNDQEKAVGALLADPRVLAVPETYIAHEPGLLPVPDVRIEFRGFGVRHEPTRSGRVVTRTSPGGENYAAAIAWPAIPDDPKRLSDLDQKLEIESLIEWCDLAFSRLSVPESIVGSARRGLQGLTNKHVLQLV